MVDLTNIWSGTNDFMAVYSGDVNYLMSTGWLSDWLSTTNPDTGETNGGGHTNIVTTPVATDIAATATNTVTGGTNGVVDSPLTIIADVSPTNAPGTVVLYAYDPDTGQTNAVDTNTVIDGTCNLTVVPTDFGTNTYIVVFIPDDTNAYIGSSVILEVPVLPVPPVATPMKVVRKLGEPLSILLTDITNNWTGTGLKLTAISNVTSNGIPLMSINLFPTGGYYPVTPGAALIYTNIGTNYPIDQFTYILTDIAGQTATGTIVIYLQDFGIANITVETPGGAAILDLRGVPGFNYDLLRSTNLLTTNWETILTTNAPDWNYQYSDAVPPQPAAFYRLRWNY